MGNLYKWAEHEVELALKREQKGDDDSLSYEYAKLCYESALKAFKSLVDDNHSGLSISITKNILDRLIDTKPLTPIEENSDNWREVSGYLDAKVYQNERLTSLFKYVYPDGKVTYHDVGAYECRDVGSHIPYYGGGSRKIFDEYCPIQFPYYPPETRYRIMIKTVLSDPANGDFDTTAYFEILTPQKTTIPVNRYFGEVDGEWKEITEDEFLKRVAMEEKRNNEQVCEN